jgi:protocatechuate 3,4-dioxygenase beta subunit
VIPEPRRSTVMAQRQSGSDNLYRFDIRLGGDRETVFFEI